MSDSVIAKDFDLTPAIKEQAALVMEKVKSILPDDATVNVHMHRESNQDYCARVIVHAWQEDVSVEEHNADLYTALTQVKHTAFTKLTRLKEKKFESHRHDHDNK